MSAVMAALQIAAVAQSRLTFDSQVHDFGQVLLGKGAVQCTFEGRNTGKEPLAIQSVTTSCGCTNVKWDHNAVNPGAVTRITATYTNDEGPYPFDKVLTVKVAGEAKPILLHLRGTSVKEILPLDKVYTIRFGNALGLTQTAFKAPNVEQGTSKGDECRIANLSGKAVKVDFSAVTDGLSLRVEPNPIPAGSEATLHYTVAARPGVWGFNDYAATLVEDGRSTGRCISVRALTCENFSGLTKEQKSAGPRPIFAESTYSFGHKRAGAVVSAKFTCTNKGAAPLKVYKVDSDRGGVSSTAFPVVKPGESGSFTVTFDTGGMPKGEALVMLTLTTNSPLRPIVNLFLAGIID